MKPFEEPIDKELLKKLTEKACFLQVDIPYYEEEPLLHFDDGVMTELECDEDFELPVFKKEDLLFEYLIDLKAGCVINRKEDYGYLRLWAKVRDGGTYTLLDADKQPIWQIRGYVPNRVLPPYDEEYGDYLELAVNVDGRIDGWRKEVDLSEFIREGKKPEAIRSNKWYRAERALRYVLGERLNTEETAWLIEQLKNR